ncbi:MAG: hypothetical protein NVS3B10_08620 [Polyangiales bacterium]
MFGRLFVASLAFSGAALALACSSTTSAAPGSSSGTSGGSSGIGATTQEIDSCKAGCDKMKFFACNSAEEQAACYAECNKATPDQIQLFTACANTSICDPACRTNITPKPAAGAPAPTGSGGTPSSCSTACDKLATCSFIKVGDKDACTSACEKQAYQYQIDCINSTSCDKMQMTCGGGVSTGGSSGTSGSSGSTGTSGSSGSSGSSGTSGTSGTSAADQVSISQCNSTCDQLLFAMCIDAATQSACRATCSASTTTTAKRDTFSSCVNASTGQCEGGNACYTTFKN